MKVVAINQDPGIAPGAAKGAAVHLSAMRHAFRTLGHEVVALDQPNAELLEHLLLREQQRGPIDMLYERYALGATTTSRFAKQHGIDHVVEVNAPLIKEALQYRGLEDVDRMVAAETEIFENTALISSVSEEVSEYCRTRTPHHAPVELHPNGIDPELFHLGLRNHARREAGIPAERFVLGFHGRLRPWHHFEALALAARAAQVHGIDVHLFCVGRGDFQGAIESATKGLFPVDRVTVQTWVPYEKVGIAIGAFDCLPLTYSKTGPHYFSPIKLREAMAVGAVPIVPAVGDLTRTVADRENGLVYAAGDQDALIGHIIELAEDAQLRANFSTAAARTAREHTWEHNASCILDTLKERTRLRVELR